MGVCSFLCFPTFFQKFLGNKLIIKPLKLLFYVSQAGMTAGVYVLRLINGNDMKTQKIVVR